MYPAKYKLRLTIQREDGEFTKGDTNLDQVLTDAFIFSSLNDDSNWNIGGWDGRSNQPLSSEEYFNLFMNLAIRLSKEGDVDWQRTIAELTHRVAQHIVGGWHDRFCLHGDKDCPLAMTQQVVDIFNDKAAQAKRMAN